MWALLVVVAGIAVAATVVAAEPDGDVLRVAAALRRNVLFITVDNYQPAMGAYGNKDAVTPQMDALAKTSTLFSRGYCQEAWCSPSRNSFLVSRTKEGRSSSHLVA